MRCVIISGGNIYNYQWLRNLIREDDTIICADSGAKHAVAAGLLPHRIVGDFDSLSPVETGYFTGEGVLLQQHPLTKDDTDTVLAFRTALSLKPEEILLTGVLGTRFDHTLGNVHLLHEALIWNIKAVILDEINEISLVAPDNPALITGRPNDVFSLLPLTLEVKGIFVNGAQWELQDSSFYLGNPFGISNRFAGNLVEISVKQGVLLLIRINEEREKHAEN